MNRNNNKWMVTGALGVVAIVVGLIVDGMAKVEKGETRPLNTATWMKNVMKPNCGALKKGIEAGPKTDDDWDALIEHAEIINETSYILMEDKRCPDGVWAEAASKTLRNGSDAVIAAAKAKDAAATEKAFKKMTEACASCHKAHKEKE